MPSATPVRAWGCGVSAQSQHVVQLAIAVLAAGDDDDLLDVAFAPLDDLPLEDATRLLLQVVGFYGRLLVDLKRQVPAAGPALEQIMAGFGLAALRAEGDA